MKILWLCNIVLPDFSEEFGLRKYHIGGWMTSMLHRLEGREEIEVAVCCPIIDAWRMKDGVCNGNKYYAFPFLDRQYEDRVKERFKVILKEYAPDVVHIWGAEYPHTLAMVNACQELGMLDRAVLYIQGMVSVYAQHYYANIPEEYRTLEVEGYPTIQAGHDVFRDRGKYEIEAIQKVNHVIGRTDWDEACTRRLNPKAQYHFCHDILRDEFYRHIGEWRYDGCEKHTIFISQGDYPIKGLHYLLKVMPDILGCYSDVCIKVSGVNPTQPNQMGNVSPYGQYIDRLIKENDLSGHIKFLGLISGEEMIAQYKQANVVVSASSIENASNSVHEAVLLGCPVVASYVGGTDSFICQGKNGFLYQHDAEYMLSYYIKKIFARQEYTFHQEAVQNLVNGIGNAEILLGIYRSVMEKL